MTTDPAGTFGAVLKRYRRAAGLTQEALAERAGLSVQGISALERGVNRTPRKDTAHLLAAALALTERERAVLLAGSATPAAASAHPDIGPLTSPLLVGRAYEVGLVERHLAGAGSPVLLLAGEPGIGKTRLLQEAARRAVAAGWRVLEGSCQQRGGQEPYTPLLPALARDIRRQTPAQQRADLRECAWLVRLLPELAQGPIPPLPSWTLPPEQERRLMFEAVGRFLANVAGPAGTLLVLDDLQWAGPDALDLLATLVRFGAAGAVPLRVVGVYRDTEVQAADPLAVLLTDLARADLLSHHQLTGLAATEAADLLGVLLESHADADGALRERLLQRAGGVPFFLISVARGLRSGVGPAEIPWDLAANVRQRVAALPEAAGAMLGVAAVAGRQVGSALLLAVAAQPEEQTLAALELACQAHLLEDRGEDGYRFAHDVIREVVEANLGTARRTVLHRRIADALEAEQGAHPSEILAYHWARGGRPDKAIPHLEQAGDQARAQQAHAAAAGYYQELVECLESLGRGREATAAREKLGQVLATMAQYDAALVVLERAAGEYQAADDQEGMWCVLAAIGHVHWRRGTPEDGVQRLQPLLDTLAHADASPGAAALYEAVAALYSYSGHYGEDLAAADRALALARAVGEERIMVAALFDRGSALTELGRRREALPALEEASRLAEARGDLDTACEALNMAGCVHEDLGAFATAQRFTERALALAEKRGDPASIAYLIVRRGTGAFFSGDWTQARADYEQALALCRQMGPSHASPYPLLDLGRLCLAEGAWSEAVRYLEESCAIATRSGDLTPLRWAQVELAEHDLLMGRPEAARARLEPLLDRPGLEEGQVSFLLPPLAQSYLESDEVEQAAALVGQSVRRARAQPNQRALVGALRVQALVLTRQECWAAVEQAVQEGLALAREMPYPYAEARLLHVYGQMYVEKGEPVRAREQWEAALAIFRRLGARSEAERVAALAALPLP